MNRRIPAMGLTAPVAAAVLLAVGVAQSAPPEGSAPLAKGWGRVAASGALAAVDPSAGTVTLAIAGAGRVDVSQGGGVWAQRPVAGSPLIHLLPATLIEDARGHAIPVSAVRPKDRASVWAVMRPDAAIFAVILAIASPPAGQGAGSAAPAPPRGIHAGVVLRRSGTALDILSEGGEPRSVVVTPGTVVRRNGVAVPAAAVSPYDVLAIAGPVNADGSLVATQIDIVFAAAAAAQLSGPVEERAAELSGLVVGGTMVAASADTYVIRDGARVPAAQIDPGRPVAVYGTPITAGSVPVGLYARVIVVR